LPGIKEEEVPTSTTYSHVNYAPAASFLAPLPGKSGRPLQGEFFARTSFTLLFALLYFTLLYFYLYCFISKTQKN
jgi:hypothetical protein